MIDFTSPGGPWVHEIDQSPSNQRLASFETVEGVITRFDGRRMGTLDARFQEHVREFRLPEYFGWHWPAFDECMTNLEWMPAKQYLTIVVYADEVLKGTSENCRRTSDSWKTSVATGRGPLL